MTKTYKEKRMEEIHLNVNSDYLGKVKLEVIFHFFLYALLLSPPFNLFKIKQTKKLFHKQAHN